MAEKNGEQENVSAGENDEQDAEDSEQRGGKAGKSGRNRPRLWIAVGLGIAIAVLIVMKRGSNTESGPPLAAVGSTVKGDLTLVNADRNELECMAEKSVQNYQCGYVDEKQTRPLQENVKLRPYMTVDRQLYLIPGLFLEPSITQRYATEPPTTPRADQKRFTAKCSIKIVGELDGVKLRWSPGGTWEAPKKFSVATVSDCKIEG